MEFSVGNYCFKNTNPMLQYIKYQKGKGVIIHEK